MVGVEPVDAAVIVTGGSTGIGAAAARAFAETGAIVLIADINVADGARVVSDIERRGGRAQFCECDVTDAVAVRELVDRAVHVGGRLTSVLANAGVEWTKSVSETTPEEWHRVITTNLTGVYLICKYSMMKMVSQGGGSIVITGSPHAIATVPDAGAYAAAKGGAVALMRALALEGAAHGVRVNALLPGTVDTPMIRREAAASNDPEAQLLRFALMQPIGRLGRPEEVAAAALFLASDAASFITGASLPVDGGLLAALASGPPLSYQ